MTTDGDKMAQGVALRLRALAATRWIDRSDEATRAALLAGADEVERLTRALADERDTVAFHVDLAESALRDLHAVCDALGARARRGDPLPAVTELVGVAQALRAQAGVPTAEVERLAAVARGAQYREREARNEVEVLRAREDGAQADAGDLAALARREAGSAHQWRQCRRCGRCFWLTAEESVPPHPTSDDPRLARACGWTVTTSEGSEGR